jgi:hypothetical protein
MIDTIKEKVMHYWSDHKVEVIVVAALVIAYLIK